MAKLKMYFYGVVYAFDGCPLMSKIDFLNGAG